MSEICKLCMHTDIKIKQFPCNACDDAFSMFKSGIEQQLQQAHRAAEESAKDAHRRGWEQGKRECENIANNLFKYESGYYHYREDVGDAIAAMEYKEPTND